MENLIEIHNNIKINKKLANTVNARDLWKKLGSKRQFSDWMKDRLQRFVENEDYVVTKTKAYKLSNNINIHEIMDIEKSTKKDNIRIDYFLTIDTTKMICMLENNEMGDKIRRYFVECEKILTIENKKRQRQQERKHLTEQRKIQVKNRLNMTDKIQEIYGEKAPYYIYANYTKLVYKKVFGFTDLKRIKKKFNMSDKETIRDTDKISQDLKDLITQYEYDIHCFLQVEKAKQTPKEQCYKLVKQFLGLDN